MKLSKNLTLAEVTKSNTAIKYGISNQPTGEHLSNLIQIANKIFQPLRDHFNTPIAVSSGYRSKALNDMIGGASGSQHMKGEAFDIDADAYGVIENWQIFDYIKNNLELINLSGSLVMIQILIGFMYLTKQRTIEGRSWRLLKRMGELNTEEYEYY